MNDPSLLALDLGSTRVKLATASSAGELLSIDSEPAPPARGAGLTREVDPAAYRAAIDSLFARLDAATRALPLGLASQRSSFLVWERASATPCTPLVSWQDRRADPWCRAHAAHEARVRALTGLPLSPHYAGPKLATLLAQDPSLAPGLADGSLAFGTLECWWTATQHPGEHTTDLSMAARTLMVDVRAGAWSDELLELYGVPRAGLPRIAESDGRAVPLALGATLVASLADQGSGLLAALGADTSSALVNVGTGGFVLRPTGARFDPVERYLCGPVLASGGRARFALEGTINGGGATVDAIAPAPTAILPVDPAPLAYCLPDENGIGAPHWRATLPTTFSAGSEGLAPAERRRLALEGLAFRVREILEDFERAGALSRIVLSGGLTHSPFLRAALASLFDGEVCALLEEEATLLGAARLAAGAGGAATGSTKTEPVARDERLARLPEKYARWRAWMAELLRAS